MEGNLVYQKKIGEQIYIVQTEFKASKQQIKPIKNKIKKIDTKKTELDYYGFETSDRPHIERFMEEPL